MIAPGDSDQRLAIGTGSGGPVLTGRLDLKVPVRTHPEGPRSSDCKWSRQSPLAGPPAGVVGGGTVSLSQPEGMLRVRLPQPSHSGWAEPGALAPAEAAPGPGAPEPINASQPEGGVAASRHTDLRLSVNPGGSWDPSGPGSGPGTAVTQVVTIRVGDRHGDTHWQVGSAGAPTSSTAGAHLASESGPSGGGNRALPDQAHAVLREWLLVPQHFAAPYPNRHQRADLAVKAGITPKQVCATGNHDH
jgi:hypothetical protein